MPKRKSENPLNRSQEAENDLDESFDENTFDVNVRKCVRYFLVASDGNFPIKKSDLRKNVGLKTKDSFQAVMQQAKKELSKIYSYKVIELEDKDISYVLIKKTHNEGFGEDRNPNRILTLLVLSHVFMSDDSVQEGSMISFLNSLGIETNRKDNFFGNVTEFVNVTLVKQKFLNVEVDGLTKNTTFSWGPRAEATISKKSILEFVCQVYSSKKNVTPDNFQQLSQQAQNQTLAIRTQNDNNTQQ